MSAEEEKVLSPRESMLARAKAKTKEITAWGQPVTIVGLDLPSRERWRVTLRKAGESPDPETASSYASASLVVHSLTDGAGNRIFSDSDIPELVGAGFEEMERVLEEILEVNGLTEKAKQATEKNSPAQTGASSTG